jgi:hypothetical protein
MANWAETRHSTPHASLPIGIGIRETCGAHFVPQRLQRSGLQNVTHHPWGEDEDCDNVTLDPGCAAAFFLEADVKQSEWQALKDSVTNLTVIVTLLAAAAVLFTAFLS